MSEPGQGVLIERHVLDVHMGEPGQSVVIERHVWMSI
jgi:hypothetical protein